MFKKLLVMLGLVTSISTFAAPMPEGWTWDLEDEAKLNEMLNQISESDYTNKGNIINQIALIGKNPENTTYDQYKKIVKDSLVGKDEHYNESFILRKMCQNAFCIPRFHKFQENVLNDPVLLADERSNSYIATWIGPRVLKTAESFRKFYFIDKNILKVDKSKAEWYKRIFKKYNEFSLNYTVDQVKDDMIFFKRLVYPNIVKGDEWKDLAVNIELLLKSVQ